MKSDGQDWAAVRELFEDLVELPVEQRVERLAAFGDARLRADVERLLAADGEAGGFMETPALALAGALLGESDKGKEEEPLPERIGSYRVLGRLGRGGMGEVLLAERADGLFEQRVAIKLLRRGMDSDEVVRRFARERRILARLEHPHIARLYDGGAAPDGRPYFVLELVEGEPITAYCRSRRLTVEEQLRLVLDCCDAVSAAHRSLVVHRDLKPSNVLVTRSGEVKLLDFGIAKLLSGGDPDSDATQTRGGERVLTPAYAAPEQVLGQPVTTATDVWALGALLYELLTGTLPRRRTSRPSGDPPQSVETEPIERPSVRVGKGSPENVASGGISGLERRRLERRLRGDLDNVLLKALRREPERRYESVAAFAEDIRRHLSGRTVLARPDTLGYRLTRFVRRQRVAVAAAALVFASLLAGLAGTAWQARRAQANARAASSAARRAEGVKEFLIGLFEIADPEQSSGGSVTAKDLIDQAGRRLETELSSEPDVQADLLEAVARIERSLGLLEPAEKLARRSLAIRERLLPSGDAAIGRSLAALGAVHIAGGRLDEGEKDLSRAVSILEKTEGPESLATARARSDFAQTFFWKGDVARAEAIERGVYEVYRRKLGEDNVLTAIHRRNLGVLLEELDRLDEAEEAYRASQVVLERRLGPDHPSLGQSYLNLAVLLERRGRVPEAEGLYRRTLDVRARSLGENHPAVGQTLQLTGLFYLNQGRLDESVAAYEKALRIFRGIDPKHFEVGKIVNGLALVASRKGRYAEAESKLSEVEALFREVLGEKHPFTWQAMGNRAEQIAAQDRLAEAEALQREVAARLSELTGPRSAETADARARLGETLRRLGRGAEAEPLHRGSLEVQLRLLGEDHASVALARFQLGADLAAHALAEKRAEARRLLEGSLRVLRKVSPPHPRLADVLRESGRLARAEGDLSRARRDLAESAGLFAGRFGDADHRTRAVRRELAASATQRRGEGRALTGRLPR